MVVEGINRVYKHLKPNRRNPQGGRLSKEMPIDASNVLLVLPDLPPRRPRRPPLRRRRPARNATARSAATGLGNVGPVKPRPKPPRSRSRPRTAETGIEPGLRVRRRTDRRPTSEDRAAWPGLLERYNKEIVPALAEKLGRDEQAAACRSCRRSSSTWASARRCRTRTAWSRRPSSWRRSPASRPQVTKAKVAVSGFRLREGNEIGCRVTLRGQRMYEFLDRLISDRPAAYPRLPRRQPQELRRQRQLQPGPDRAAGLPRDRPRQGDFTQGMDITFVTRRATTTRPASCCGPSACRSASRNEQHRCRPDRTSRDPTRQLETARRR